MPTRRERIEAMLQEDPSDVFLQYSLAMELCSEGDIEGGIQRLVALSQGNPPYIPACFMAAQRYVDRDQVGEARAILRYGIDAAREQGDRHAAAEMSEYLANLGELGE